MLDFLCKIFTSIPVRISFYFRTLCADIAFHSHKNSSVNFALPSRAPIGHLPRPSPACPVPMGLLAARWRKYMLALCQRNASLFKSYISQLDVITVNFLPRQAQTLSGQLRQ